MSGQKRGERKGVKRWEERSIAKEKSAKSPWMINRGVSPFSGDSSLLEGVPPLN